MIANISPSILTIEETINTLKYANRAKNIKIKIKKNVVENSYHISKYDDIINALKSEIEELKGQLTKKESEESQIQNNLDYFNETGNFGKNKELIDKLQNILNIISNHFAIEIKIRKEIIEIEKQIENNKNQIAQKEFELYKCSNKNDIEKIKKILTNLNSENEKNSKTLNEKYLNQSEFIKKRSEVQKQITKFSKQNSFGIKILMNTYHYYSSQLENMTLDHRKNTKFTDIKVKDLEIEKLIDQIRIRDNMINNFETELKKKTIPFKFSNNNIKSIKQIEEEPLNLPLIIKEFPSINNKNFEKKNEKRMNSPVHQPRHRTFDYELTPLIKKKIKNIEGKNSKSLNTPMKTNNNKITNYKNNQNPKGKMQKTGDRFYHSHESSYRINNNNKINNQVHNELAYFNDEAQDKLYYINNNLGKKMKFNLQNLKYLITSQIENYEENETDKNKSESNLETNMNINKNENPSGNSNTKVISNMSSNFNKNINHNLNKSFQSNHSTSWLEKEMDKKVKTILKRNLLSRYHKSPYLKNIENN